MYCVVDHSKLSPKSYTIATTRDIEVLQSSQDQNMSLWSRLNKHTNILLKADHRPYVQHPVTNALNTYENVSI